jgi:hypothetical protein
MINVDNPEAFKESVLDTIQWTEATIGDRLRFVCEQCYVNEDAGVLLKLPIHTQSNGRVVMAWLDLPVCGQAEADYKTRLTAAAVILREKFHVEQSTRPGDRDDQYIHRLIIRHEYDRPV